MKKKTRDVTFRKGRLYFKGKLALKIQRILDSQGVTAQEWFDQYFIPELKKKLK